MGNISTININPDIEAKEFKENFFYHFDKKQTFTIFVALGFGAAAYAVGYSLGLKSELLSILMAAVCILPLMIGFFVKQGFGFLDYMRKCFLLRRCSELVWESTEDPEKERVCKCRGRRLTDSELHKET